MPAIVCGSTDSNSSREALRLAASLSERLGLRLVVAHVVSITCRDGDAITTAEAMQIGRRLISRVLEEEYLDQSVQVRVEVGEPVLGLAWIANEEAADLVVVGAGRGGVWVEESFAVASPSSWRRLRTVRL